VYYSLFPLYLCAHAKLKTDATLNLLPNNLLLESSLILLDVDLALLLILASTSSMGCYCHQSSPCNFGCDLDTDLLNG
jgi:hypothetical protein